MVRSLEFEVENSGTNCELRTANFELIRFLHPSSLAGETTLAMLFFAATTGTFRKLAAICQVHSTGNICRAENLDAAGRFTFWSRYARTHSLSPEKHPPET